MVACVGSFPYGIACGRLEERYVVSVLTALILVARFWKFVEPVLTNQKPVRRTHTLVESELTAATLLESVFTAVKPYTVACIGSFSCRNACRWLEEVRGVGFNCRKASCQVWRFIDSVLATEKPV